MNEPVQPRSSAGGVRCIAWRWLTRRPRQSGFAGLMAVGLLVLAACGQGGTGGGGAADFGFSLYQGEEVLGSKQLTLLT